MIQTENLLRKNVAEIKLFIDSAKLYLKIDLQVWLVQSHGAEIHDIVTLLDQKS